MRIALALFVVVALALASLGCAARVAGTDDVELTYEAALGDGPARYGEDLRALVLRRLSAGEVGADVDQDGTTLKIVVDENFAPTVDELVTWSGTILFLEPDPHESTTPRDDRGLVARSETLPDGTVDHYWEGSKADIARAVDQWITDADHRVVAEAIWSSSKGSAAARWRTRMLKARPAGELGEGVLVGWGEHGALRLRAAKGSAAETALAAARERAKEAKSPALREVLVRGRTSLGRPTIDGDAAHLSFGDGIEAYARAQDERQLLTTARLPPLRRTGAVGLPPNTTLVTACFVVPIVLSFAWLAFIRRFDRAHPEPMWLIMVTFVLGALSTVPAGLAEVALARLTPWLDPRVISFGGQPFALPLAFVVFTFVVGLSEESAKLLGAGFAMRRREFDEPVDGIVYGIVSSLGFAAAENVQYFALARLSAPIVVARCFMSVPAHMFFGAIWGYALGARLVDDRPRLLLFLLLSAAGHGLFDALLATDGGGGLAIVLNVALASVFIALVRRSLRHGIVDEASRAVRPEDRRLFRVGRPGLFFLSAVAVHILAFGIVVLGGWYQLARHRPNATFVIGSSIMLALLAVAALGVSWTLPLDVAVDEYGVTFAGAARAWSRIRKFDAFVDRIVLDCEAGPIILGPGKPEVIEKLARSLRKHIGEKPADRTKTLESLSDSAR